MACPHRVSSRGPGSMPATRDRLFDTADSRGRRRQGRAGDGDGPHGAARSARHDGARHRHASGRRAHAGGRWISCRPAIPIPTLAAAPRAVAALERAPNAGAGRAPRAAHVGRRLGPDGRRGRWPAVRGQAGRHAGVHAGRGRHPPAERPAQAPLAREGRLAGGRLPRAPPRRWRCRTSSATTSA